ncbi:TPA: hypothetical protein ACSG64_002125 [Escherichia coli]
MIINTLKMSARKRN